MVEFTFSGGYSQCWKAIIRPPRDQYSEEELGPKDLQIVDMRCIRKDFDIKNSRGHTLKCSWWDVHSTRRPKKKLPCVIFLHGNGSSRRGAFPCLEVLLP